MEASMSGTDNSDELSTRVCDRCIRKKVKCDKQRPTCSRCREVNATCSYGSVKHKPGPARGSRRPVRGARVDKRSNNDEPHAMHTPKSWSSGYSDDHAVHGMGAEQSRSVSRQLTAKPQPDPTSAPWLLLDPQEAHRLLEYFFQDIHPAIPIFAQTKFFQLYDSNLINDDLIATLVTITAKVLGVTYVKGIHDLDACLQYLLDTTAIEDDVSNESMSLDLFRKEMLLAYYNFHQTPGQRSVMRIRRLTCKAYLLGLHQLENIEFCPLLKSESVMPDEVEEWRSLWWCVYCLDSYSNMSCGVPYGVEVESLNTALPQCSLEAASAGVFQKDVHKILLPLEPAGLWKTVQDIVSYSSLVDFNLHIVTTTMLRLTGTLFRIHSARPSEEVEPRRAILEKSYAAVRLALPDTYLNSARNTLQNESGSQHLIRLTTVLHLLMNNILISIPPPLRGHEVEWERRWQQVIEQCRNVVALLNQWDTRYSYRIDPAICFIAYAAGNMVTMQRKCVSSSASLRASLEQDEGVLKMFLGQFAKIWELPRYLLELYEERVRSLPPAMTYEDIDKQLLGFKAPLYPKLMQSFPHGLPLWGIDTTNDLNNFLDNWDFEHMRPLP